MKKCLILNNNHKCKLPTNTYYNFKILEACFNLSGTVLQMMILLESLDNMFRDIIIQEIELESQLFERFVSVVYAIEHCKVIDFNLENIKTFTGITRLERDNETGNIYISWEDLMPLNIPVSSVEHFRTNPNAAITSINDSSQFMILKNGHKCDLLTDLEYQFAIIMACFSPKGDTLQLMILLEYDDLNHRDIILEEYPTNSEDFNKFVDVAYRAESFNVIDFDTSRMDDVFGTVYLKSEESGVHIDWDTANIESSPLSSAGIITQDWY